MEKQEKIVEKNKKAMNENKKRSRHKKDFPQSREKAPHPPHNIKEGIRKPIRRLRDDFSSFYPDFTVGFGIGQKPHRIGDKGTSFHRMAHPNLFFKGNLPWKSPF